VLFDTFLLRPAHVMREDGEPQSILRGRLSDRGPATNRKTRYGTVLLAADYGDITAGQVAVHGEVIVCCYHGSEDS
jgi:hypothetical protein